MTAYTTISNALVAVGAKPFATTIQALRDNPIAIAEADSTVALNLLPTVLIGSGTTTSGTTSTISSLVLTPYRFLLAVYSCGLNFPSTVGGPNFSIGSANLFTFPAGGAFTASGMVFVELQSGRTGNVGGAGTSPVWVPSATSGISAASTSVSLSVNNGGGPAFTSGAWRLYGLK